MGMNLAARCVFATPSEKLGMTYLEFGCDPACLVATLREAQELPIIQPAG